MNQQNTYIFINKSLADNDQIFLESSFPSNLGGPWGPTKGPHIKFFEGIMFSDLT